MNRANCSSAKNAVVQGQHESSFLFEDFIRLKGSNPKGNVHRLAIAYEETVVIEILTIRIIPRSPLGMPTRAGRPLSTTATVTAVRKTFSPMRRLQTREY